MKPSCLYKVRPGKLQTLTAWLSDLNTIHRQEALGTLKYEGIDREIYILFKGTDDNHYVLGLVYAEGQPKKADLKVKLNQKHNEIKAECLEKVSEKGEILTDLSL